MSTQAAVGTSRNSVIEIYEILCGCKTDKAKRSALKRIEALSPAIAKNVKKRLGILVDKVDKTMTVPDK
jgi:hypothetical protein